MNQDKKYIIVSYAPDGTKFFVHNDLSQEKMEQLSVVYELSGEIRFSVLTD